jgi:two-component system, NtrC family, nitrogen regulation response regulator NtrX
MASGRVLIVDDEESICSTLRQILEDEGYSVEECGEGERALHLLDHGEFDAVLLDVWLPGMDGIEVLHQITLRRIPVEVVVISGHGTIETAVKATKLGALDFIEKPLSLERILLAMANAIKKRRLEQKTQILSSQLQREVTLVGVSPAIQALKMQVQRAAPTSGRVLILGENGTGKEVVARLIHQNSNRAAEPFVELNCAAIPTELIESELFGHRKGAFTGAVENKKGKFLLADGGTLLLDEVGDMSLTTQAKVLRVLEEQAFEPVGGSETRRVDVRVIAATNKNLPEEIARGRFREDLYYRLNVLPIVVPPLRERAQDIPLLCEYYLEYYTRQYGIPVKRLSPDASRLLMAYPWPGNVRELRNLMERLMIMVPGPEILPPHLSLDIPAPAGALIPREGPLKEAREAFERSFILKSLSRNAWHITRTAEELQIERRHLYRRMATLNIRKEDGHGDD